MLINIKPKKERQNNATSKGQHNRKSKAVNRALPLSEAQKPENKIFNRHRDRIYIFDNAFHVAGWNYCDFLRRWMASRFRWKKSSQREASIFKKSIFMNIKFFYINYTFNPGMLCCVEC